MATKTTKQSAKIVKSNEPVTGLNETLPEITAKAQACADTLLDLIPAKVRKGKEVEILNAAYAYGLCERRRRKLARKVNGSGSEE